MRPVQVFLVASAFVLVGRTAHAALINFDDVSAPSLFIQATALTTQYSGLGVTFSGNGAILNENAGFGVQALSGDNFLAYNTGATLQGGGISTGPLEILFSVPVTSFSIFFSGGAQAAPYNVQVRDSGNNLVLTGSGSAPGGAYAEISFSFSGTDIGRVTITSTTDPSYVFDNLSFTGPAPGPTPVPEPATLSLLGVGLAGAAVRRFRKRN